MIDKNEAYRLLELAVAERGKDYVYPYSGNCKYVRDGLPDCGVALALSKSNEITLDEIATWDTWIGSLPIDLVPAVALTNEAIVILRAFQKAQDARTTWGQALFRAAIRSLSNAGIG